MTAGKCPASNNPTLHISAHSTNLVQERVSQEAQGIESLDILYCSRCESKSGPSELQKGNIIRSLDTSQNEVGWDLPNDICGGPQRIGIVELIAVHVQVFLHTRIEGISNVHSGSLAFPQRRESAGTHWSMYRIITPNAAEEIRVKSSLVRNLASSEGTSRAAHINPYYLRGVERWR